jgi:hypothetical protein
MKRKWVVGTPIQAHISDLTDAEGLMTAVLGNCSNFSAADLKHVDYKTILKLLLSMYTSKKLLIPFVLVCAKKIFNNQSILTDFFLCGTNF